MLSELCNDDLSCRADSHVPGFGDIADDSDRLSWLNRMNGHKEWGATSHLNPIQSHNQLVTSSYSGHKADGILIAFY